MSISARSPLAMVLVMAGVGCVTLLSTPERSPPVRRRARPQPVRSCRDCPPPAVTLPASPLPRTVRKASTPHLKKSSNRTPKPRSHIRVQRYRRRMAILINSDTENRHVNNIQTAYGHLTGKAGFKPCDVYVVSDRYPLRRCQENGAWDIRLSDATIQTLEMAVTEVSRRVTPEDLLVVYLTGHGLPAAYPMSTHLPQMGRKSYHLVPDHVAALLRKVRARTVVLITDICYGGLFVQNVLATLRWIDKEKVRPILAIHPAYADCAYCQAFTPHFWRALEEPKHDRDGDGAVSLLEAFYATMHRYAEQAELKTNFLSHIDSKVFRRGVMDVRWDGAISNRSPTIDAQEAGKLRRNKATGVVLISSKTCPPCAEAAERLDLLRHFLLDRPKEMGTWIWESRSPRQIIERTFGFTSTFRGYVPHFLFLRRGRVVGERTGAMDLSELRCRVATSLGLLANRLEKGLRFRSVIGGHLVKPSSRYPWFDGITPDSPASRRLKPGDRLLGLYAPPIDTRRLDTRTIDYCLRGEAHRTVDVTIGRGDKRLQLRLKRELVEITPPPPGR